MVQKNIEILPYREMANISFHNACTPTHFPLLLTSIHAQTIDAYDIITTLRANYREHLGCNAFDWWLNSSFLFILEHFHSNVLPFLTCCEHFICFSWLLFAYIFELSVCLCVCIFPFIRIKLRFDYIIYSILFNGAHCRGNKIGSRS